MDVAYQAQTNIADSSREFQMQKAAFDQEVNARKAEAELSYELQVHCKTLICVKQRRIAWNKISVGKFHVVNVNKQQQRNVHIIVHVIIMLCYPKLLHLNCHSHCYHHNRC